MDEITSVLARNNFSDWLNRVHYAKERLPVTRRGKVVAILVPPEDHMLLARLDDPKWADLKAAILAEGEVPWAQLKRQLRGGDDHGRKKGGT